MFLPEEKIKAHIHIEDNNDSRQEVEPQCLQREACWETSTSPGKRAIASLLLLILITRHNKHAPSSPLSVFTSSLLRFW